MPNKYIFLKNKLAERECETFLLAANRIFQLHAWQSKNIGYSLKTKKKTC